MFFGSNGEENDSLYDYEIGSISKTFVGLLCAKAIFEGKLNLDDSISSYLDLGDARYYSTIERLLTHTSGYKSYYFDSKMIGNKLARISNDFYGISRADIFEKAKQINLENRDYSFEYSNFGISVLGLVLEKIYNDSFTNLMNNYISSELGLSDTRVAKQTGDLDKYWKWKANDGYIPAGSIISNIKVWHNGATTDFNSYIGFNKDKKKGVVVLSNLNANDKISMTVIGAKLLLS